MNDVENAQYTWMGYFPDDEYYPSETACRNLLKNANNDIFLVNEAIQICSKSEKMQGRSFEDKLAYTFGIIHKFLTKRNEDRVKRGS